MLNGSVPKSRMSQRESATKLLKLGLSGKLREVPAVAMPTPSGTEKSYISRGGENQLPMEPGAQPTRKEPLTSECPQTAPEVPLPPEVPGAWSDGATSRRVRSRCRGARTTPRREPGPDKRTSPESRADAVILLGEDRR